jgi:FkbM family methyltransferase
MTGWRNLLNHVRDRLSARRKELYRLKGFDRFVPATTTLIPPQFAVVDAASFLAMHRAIIEQQVYDFQTDSDRPRILDCGANVGVAAVWFRQRFPDAQIVAFEPDPVVYDVLRQNVRTICSDYGFELVNAAVWCDESPELAFAAEGADAGRIATEADPQPTVVRAVRLRSYLQEPVDLLKLDIEGAELAVLEDCRDQLHRVRNLFVEYHSFDDQPQRLDELLTLLRETGFRYWIDSEVERSRPLINRTSYLGMDLQLNIYAVRNSNPAERPNSTESH